MAMGIVDVHDEFNQKRNTDKIPRENHARAVKRGGQDVGGGFFVSVSVFDTPLRSGRKDPGPVFGSSHFYLPEKRSRVTAS